MLLGSKRPLVRLSTYIPRCSPYDTVIDSLDDFSHAVPELQRGTLRWFWVAPGVNQQMLHVAYDRNPATLSTSNPSSRHPCFEVGSPEKLRELQERIYAFHKLGKPASPFSVS